jgi:vacuolar-type H+-ATPase subunit I/STV1
MESTRINTKKLNVAVAKATKKIEEANALLAPYLVLLTENERARMPRAREGFSPVGRSLVRAIAEHPEVATASGFEAKAVVEDLDNVEALAPLVEKVSELGRRLADSRLTWLAEAWVPSLTAYGVAKALSKSNAALRTVIAPLAEMFATRRARAQGAAPPAAPPAK